MPEDSPHGRFATEDSPQRRFATQRVRHTNVTENLSVSVGQTFATVPMRKIRHATVIGWGWVGRVGVRGVGVGGIEVGGVRSEDRVGGFPILPNPPNPNPPDFNPPNPNPPDPTPTYHRSVANLPHRHCCKRLSHAYAQILGHIRMSHPLCGESSLWRIFCGEA